MVAVIIPAYNRGKKLQEALNSLVSQTDKNFITVIVDDNSTEPLTPIIDNFKKKLIIHYIKLSQNGGPGIARQAGLNWCYQNKLIKYVIFLDSDDMLFPHAVYRLKQEIIDGDYNIVSSRISYENKDLRTTFIEAENIVYLHGKIFKISFLYENNIDFGTLRTNEDMCFLHKAYSLTELVGIMEESYYLFRYDKNSLTRNYKEPYAFDVRSTDYIDAIYELVTFLKEKNIQLNHYIITRIYNCYNFYEAAKILNMDVSSIKKKLKFLFSLPEILCVAPSYPEVNKILQIISCGVVVQDKVCWFYQTFPEFLKEILQ